MERGVDGGGGWHVNISGWHVKDGRYALWQAACGWGLWIHAEGAGNMFGQREDTGTEHVATRDVWMGCGGCHGRTPSVSVSVGRWCRCGRKQGSMGAVGGAASQVGRHGC